MMPTTNKIIVQTVEGQLQGCIKENLDGEKFFCFLGVPYAQPPVGNLRFKDPRPLQKWSGIKDATKEGEPFIQKDTLITMTNLVFGGEDGLHLNLFTKKLNSQESKLNPVMVWIHGGGFREGRNNTDVHGPEFLMLEDIVLVCINYRLGILGSLKLDDPSLEVPGNAGLKDQIEALKWIQRNIRNFGGDPKNVTIFGESAGAASVHFLVLSPLAKGLFHRAILQSGSAINNWAVGPKFLPKILAAANKKNVSEKEALDYLRSLSLRELLHMQVNNTDAFGGSYSPMIEKESPTACITKEPIEYITSGEYNKVPMMMGYCSFEMLFIKALFPEELKYYNHEMIFSKSLKIDETDNLVQNYLPKLKEHYEENERGSLELASDAFFSMGVIGAAINHAKTSNQPVYLYQFSLDTERNYVKVKKNIKDRGKICQRKYHLWLNKFAILGCSHLDDTGYLFKTTLPLPRKGSEADKYVRRIVKLWTSFAKYGKPTLETDYGTVDWKPVERDVTYYVDIDKKSELKINPKREKVEFWKRVYRENSSTANYL
ncbi:unnamed protein product [Phyllotreta striolata]|uniref:Carboxylic ester hydrolase n=1 Tax=Phyllotreta striolata TaxID=444603 RepID=A0A9N9TPW7_PHYSR|nr:unnamed protein product [Phyllotreta striolata]